MKISLIYGKFSSINLGTVDPKDLFSKIGLTGSESYFFLTARGLAEMEYDVTAFFPCPEATTWSQVKCVPLDQMNLAGSDVVISWNETFYLKDAPGLRICCHQYNDFDYCPPGHNEYVDVYVSPSDGHRAYIRETCGVPSDKQETLPNCIDIQKIKKGKHDPFKMIWGSSPDRGLHHVLEWFPEIRRQVPQATLGIAYKFLPWVRGVAPHPIDPRNKYSTALGIRARYIAEALERLGTNGENGVTLLGQLSNDAMADALSKAGVLAYPCDPVKYTEGFGVAILDACAAGVVPVISDADALGGVYAHSGVEIIKGKPTAAKWIPAIVKAMHQHRDRGQEREQQWANGFSYQKSAHRWGEMIDRRLAKPQLTGYHPGSRRKIAIFMDPSIKGHRADFSPDTLLSNPRGLSGTELAAIVSAQHLGKKHDVTLFTFTQDEGKYQGIRWKRKFDNDHYDIGIAHYDPRTLFAQHKKFDRTVAMFQSGDLRHVDYARLPTLTKLLAASHPQAMRLHSLHPNLQFHVIQNGVDFDVYAEERVRTPKVKGRCIWNASPDRGLHHLLDLWPRIRHAVPYATLHIYYDMFHLFQTFTDPNQGPMYWRVKSIKDSLDRLKDQGVIVMGGVSRNEIVKAEVEASVLAYTCDPPIWCECYPTSILECCAAGAVPIITDADSLLGIFGDVASCVPVSRLRDEFADEVIAALQGQRDPTPALKFSQTRDNRVMCQEWDALVESLYA